MPYREPILRFIGGRLALDFVNLIPLNDELSWDQLIEFLQSTRIVTSERGGELLALNRSDPQAAESLLRKAQRLAAALRLAFDAMLHKQKILHEWIKPVNEILRITEGHDVLICADNNWEIQFVASESGLEWLLAAVARSAAEIIAEGPRARLRICANPRCGLFFYDTSRTHRRRWCSMTVCGNRHKVAAFARRHARP
ncbi:MAG TPA: CGNR zinc finger domain-containing protein [Candidatus Acidoferrum sp.]|nr:CGNR zinc finger domain-containing protein [Candidatus Acidoferrum sp.]